MPPLPDVFNQDAFSMETLTDAINKMPFVPGRAGQVPGWEERGVATTQIVIEERDGLLTLLPTLPRGAPATQKVTSKRKVRSLVVPHIPYEDTVQASEVQDVREFGSESALQGVQSVVNERLDEMAQAHDATLEHLRIGALKGLILDADLSTIYNLFTEFGVSAPADVDFDLGASNPTIGDVRKLCHQVQRDIEDELGAAVLTGVHGFCGKDFFDGLVVHPEVRESYERWQANGQVGEFLRQRMHRRAFPYAGIMFEEYRGTVGGVQFIADEDCRFFPVGVRGLYRNYYAPADFMETTNTIGIPRYAKQAPDAEFNRWVKLHTQSNPLPIVTRPRVLIRGHTSS